MHRNGKCAEKPAILRYVQQLIEPNATASTSQMRNIIQKSR